MKNWIGISLGDATGVGPEVALKAIAAEAGQDETRYLLIGDPKIPTPQYTDIQAEIANPITVTVSETTDESTFRFAPGNKQG